MDRKEAVELYERIEGLITSFNENSGIGLNKGFQTAHDNWAWLHLRRIFVTNAIEGIVISISFAFIILTITTRNVKISLIATGCISCIILMLMGSIVIMGGKFGLVESTCVIVFIGISVDYVVHICHCYIHSIELDRLNRTNNAFK